jgi:hypothetical protein
MPSECACSLEPQLGPFPSDKGHARTLNCKLAFHGVRTHLLSTQSLSIIIHVLEVILAFC